MISVKKMHWDVRSKELFEVNPARGDRPISQTVWDFTYQSNEKIPFRLSFTVICIFFRRGQISDW